MRAADMCWGVAMLLSRCFSPKNRRGWFLALSLVVMGAISPGIAAESSFPFDKELILEARPMKGSKRVPILTIGSQGEAEIDLWCNSVKAQLVIAGNTITILTGSKTDRQCEPARMKGDDDLLAALLEVTEWRRDGEVLILSGGKTLRFRMASN
jgi:heat shock protein HslJ